MSKFIDKFSVPSTKSELDLYTVPPTQVVVRRSFWEQVHLQNPCTNDGPYEFRIPPDMYMLHLSKNYIYMRIRIVRPDGTALQVTQPLLAGDEVAPINLLANTFFKQIKLYLNGKLISDSSDKYSYHAFIENELNFGPEAKECQLQAAHYRKDRPPNHIDDNQNIGWQERREPFVQSQWVELMAPVHADLFQQDRYLISQAELRLEMYCNSDQFYLMAFGANVPAYRIQVQQMCFFVKKVEVVESVSLAIEKLLEMDSVKYLLRRIQMSTMTITENRNIKQIFKESAYYLMQWCRGYSMYNIMSHFSYTMKTYENNDFTVSRYVKKRFNFDLPIDTIDFVVQQICKALNK